MAARASTGTWVATANSFNPAVTGTTIDASSWNAILAELQVEVTDSMNRSGKGGMLANLDMSSNNVINLASASADHHAVRFDQVVQGDAGAGGVRGLVPAPAAGDAAAEKFLKADGTWATTPAGSSATTALSGVVELATAAEYRANTADRALSTDQVWSAADLVTLTDGATITPDMSTFINAVVTLGGNRTLANPTNPKAGQSGVILIKQDGTGSRTLSYGTNWKFANAVAPTLTTTASRTDKLYYFVESATIIHASLEKDSR